MRSDGGCNNLSAHSVRRGNNLSVRSDGSANNLGARSVGGANTRRSDQVPRRGMRRAAQFQSMAAQQQQLNRDGTCQVQSRINVSSAGGSFIRAARGGNELTQEERAGARATR